MYVNRIISFLPERQQLCKVGSKLSAPASINRSIIQGSGIGHTLYIAMKSDLTTLGNCNVGPALIIKYADDVDLLVPEHSSVHQTTV